MPLRTSKLSCIGILIGLIIYQVNSSIISSSQIKNQKRFLHAFQKRQEPSTVSILGTFPALGGPDKQGKVFTLTGSSFGQSNNVLNTATRPHLQFLAVNPEEKAISNKDLNKVTSKSSTKTTSKAEKTTSNLKVEAEVDEALPSSKAAQREDHGSLEDTLKRRLRTRSLSNESFHYTTHTNLDNKVDIEIHQIDNSFKALGPFPALGGLQGTVTAQEAQSKVQTSPPLTSTMQTALTPETINLDFSSKTIEEICKEYINNLGLKRAS
ncbi:hypothetical protein BY996DRAFT_8688975 [Phakopsora pachyrhizi]|nr:hypothetical protein BY996DRAFT_8688975 [Phakopsora pachyrhizi]